MKSYVDKHFGNNSRYKDVPHDVFTRIVFDYPPKHFVTNHVAYLCRSVKNFIIDFNNSKNNHLELLIIMLTLLKRKKILNLLMNPQIGLGRNLMAYRRVSFMTTQSMIII